MSHEELEATLAAAKARFDRILSGEAQGDWREEHQALLAAERALTLARGEEAALPCDWEVPWDIGAPSPHVLAAGGRAFLFYLARQPDPAWDGSSVEVVDPAAS